MGNIVSVSEEEACRPQGLNSVFLPPFLFSLLSTTRKSLINPLFCHHFPLVFNPLFLTLSPLHPPIQPLLFFHGSQMPRAGPLV